jgi:lysozyme family protein
MPTLTNKLRDEYEQLFAACQVRSERRALADKIVDKVSANAARYKAAGTPLGIPWYFIGAIHNLESSLSFSKHLHNGDPLTARTVQVPAGRPKSGQPPFSWEVSAADALTYEKLDVVTDWSLSGTLYRMEAYNGWGYRSNHPDVLSPYLWSFSNHYAKGKYVADGKWNVNASSEQCGGVVVLRRLAELGQISFPPRPSAPAGAPSVVAYSMVKSKNAAEVARAEALQQWLNTHAGIFVRVDGAPGERTSSAYKVITGKFLPGDPRQT